MFAVHVSELLSWLCSGTGVRRSPLFFLDNCSPVCKSAAPPAMKSDLNDAHMVCALDISK